ncbi:alpha/beta-hydrolase [Amylocystis lapponica]|nr:alpha/beta-hydrolase [Amylocystis lapponica]
MLGSQAALLALFAVAVPSVGAQLPPSSWPHAYPGMPSGDYSPEWQSYFEVTEPLPNVTWDLAHSYAGSISVQREEHPNNTLFFWAFEKENGSLTADSNEPWGIWLNGGPGGSSLLGLLYENGPVHIAPNTSIYQNKYSWDTIADYVWIDQPVGTGWSTADQEGFVHDEEQVASDFIGFLENLVKVFPSLKTRPLHLTGESYAGTYIPYITKAYFGLSDPPVKLAKIAIGDGTLGSGPTYELLPTPYTVETYPQLIGYDPEVFEWFREQTHLCGYDLNLTYPQDGPFPNLQNVEPTDQGQKNAFHLKKSDSARSKRELLRRGRERYSAEESLGTLRKRDLTGRSNGTIDSWYGCYTYDAMIDYALNYSYPWSEHDSNGFDVYQVPDALDPEVPLDGSPFFNDPHVVAALHAPTSNPWVGERNYPFLGGADYSDPSVEPMAFLTELASNATAGNLSIVIYSGNDDTLVSHRGSEVVIQNTTFGGIQGFTRKPATPWHLDDGTFAGIVHQERNWTYVLVKGAGHLIADNNPVSALVFLREFVFGNNQTGLVTDSGVIGGEDPALAQDILLGQEGIYVGSGTTQSTYTYPSATIAAWESFIATATATGSPAASA